MENTFVLHTLKAVAVIGAAALYLWWIVSVVNLPALIVALMVGSAMNVTISVMRKRSLEESVTDLMWLIVAGTTFIGIIETIIHLV